MVEEVPGRRFLYKGQLFFGVLTGLYLAYAYANLPELLRLAPRPFLVTLAWLGGLLVFAVYVGNLNNNIPLSDYSRACKNCDRPINRYSEFCEHCGLDLVYRQEYVKCRECAAELAKGTVFCPECGTEQGRKGKRATS